MFYKNKRAVPKKVGIRIVQRALASPTLVGPPNIGDALDLSDFEEEEEELDVITGNWTLVGPSQRLVATFVGATWEVPVRWVSNVGSPNSRWVIIAHFQNFRCLLEPGTQCFARYYSH